MQWHFFLNLQTINACFCATFCGSNRNVCNVTVYFWLARGHSVSVITNAAVSYVVRLCLLCKSHRFNDFFLWNTVWKQCLPQQIFAQCTLKKNVFSLMRWLMKKSRLTSLQQPNSWMLFMFGHTARNRWMQKGVKRQSWKKRTTEMKNQLRNFCIQCAEKKESEWVSLPYTERHPLRIQSHIELLSCAQLFLLADSIRDAFFSSNSQSTILFATSHRAWQI